MKRDKYGTFEDKKERKQNKSQNKRERNDNAKKICRRKKKKYTQDVNYDTRKEMKLMLSK